MNNDDIDSFLQKITADDEFYKEVEEAQRAILNGEDTMADLFMSKATELKPFLAKGTPLDFFKGCNYLASEYLEKIKGSNQPVDLRSFLEFLRDHPNVDIKPI